MTRGKESVTHNINYEEDSSIHSINRNSLCHPGCACAVAHWTANRGVQCSNPNNDSNLDRDIWIELWRVHCQWENETANSHPLIRRG